MDIEIDRQVHPELVPLEDGRPHRYISIRRQNSVWGRKTKLKGPLRAIKLVILIVLLPTLLIAVPMYMRLYMYGGQFYPVGMTDMRLIDGKMSTTWCQRQVVRSNATFNAFLVSQKPRIAETLIPVSMTRELSLDDDMKEYWGFYLLEGSIVTVSTCVRWPGASLIMIRGHKHLQECAYIGDDSSEELEEIIEAGNFGNITMIERLRELLQDGPANQPGAMKRHDSEIFFHDPAQVDESVGANHLSNHPASTSDRTDNDPEELRNILDRLHALRETNKNKNRPPWRKPKNIIAVPQMVNRHRETNININEKKWLVFQELVQKRNNSRSRMEKIIEKMRKDQFDGESRKGSDADFAMAAEDGDDIYMSHEMKTLSDEIAHDIGLLADLKTQGDTAEIAQVNNNIFENDLETPFAEIRTTSDIKDVIENNNSDKSTKEAEINIDKIYNEVYNRLINMGDKGERVLKILQKDKAEKSDKNNTINGTNINEDKEAQRAEMLQSLKDIILEVITEHANEKNGDIKLDRPKREFIINQTLEKELNDDDERGNAAIEDTFMPDGIAEHHEVINETTIGDMSNSEFWSSFSSSEEALLSCTGLILNLPLTPRMACKKDSTDDEINSSSLPNAVTYRVPVNGYYFFVFNSENEVQTNYIRVRFDLQKTTYDLTELLMACKNSTGNCSLPLGFLSREKVVLEVPLRNNDSLWNEQFVVLSECEPRTAVYVFCAIAVPITILIFGLQ